MSKFNVGDKVRIIKEIHGHCFRVGEVVEVEDLESDGSIDHCRNNKGDSWAIASEEVELIPKRGPPKPKKIKYIAQYEIDGDPVKEFYSRPELMKWLKQCEEEDVKWESIRIYPVDKVMKPHKNVKISLRSV